MKNGSPDWKNLSPKTEIDAALMRVMTRQWSGFVEGVLAYRRHGFGRPVSDARIVWQHKSATLARYGNHDSVPVIYVPSLVNRGYILDLHPQQSMLRFLQDQGIDGYLLEWGEPLQDFADFGVAEYVTQILLPAIQAVKQQTGQAPVLLGYCMGGILALAAAVLAADDVRAFVALATPWDFTKFRAPLNVYPRYYPPEFFSLMVDQMGSVPVDLLQLMFALLDPVGLIHKFTQFPEKDPQSLGAEIFVATEDWLNDGVPLTPGVAKETYKQWACENQLLHQTWQLEGVSINPSDWTGPTLVILSTGDQLVPVESGMPLYDALPQAELLQPDLGHIGMMVSRSAAKKLWEPLANWLLDL